MKRGAVLPFKRWVSLLFLYGTGTKLRGLFGDERPLLGEEFPSEIKEFRVVDWENCCCFWFMTIALRDRADNTSPAQANRQALIVIIINYDN